MPNCLHGAEIDRFRLSRTVAGQFMKGSRQTLTNNALPKPVHTQTHTGKNMARLYTQPDNKTSPALIRGKVTHFN